MKPTPTQIKLMQAISQGQGRGTLQVTGRGTGKSQLAAYHHLWNDIFGPTVELMESANVDDELWHTVRCQSHVGEWLRKQDPNMWYEHNADAKFAIMRNKFDIHDKLFLMLQLKFSC